MTSPPTPGTSARASPAPTGIPILLDGFPDNGSYPVTLTVTDAAGRTATVTKRIEVANADPTIQAVPLVDVPAGASAVIPVQVDDPGPEDRGSLRVTVNLDVDGWPDLVRHLPAGSRTVDLGVVPAGVHDAQLTVEDLDGGRAVTWVRLFVRSDATPPPPDPPAPCEPGDDRCPRPQPVAGECAVPVLLDGEESALLTTINADRRANGLPAIVASPALTRAALRHSRDLAVHDLVQHEGTDGSTFTTRVAEAGYPGTASMQFVSASDRAFELWTTWRTSGQTTTFRDERTVAVGISRVELATGPRWTIVAGDVTDCPTVAPGVGDPPSVLLSVPPTADEGATVVATALVTDPQDDVTWQRIDWGDGTTSSTPSHRYLDQGTYTVRYVVADEAGHVTAATATVVVANVAPEVAVEPATLAEGAAGQVRVRVVDPGEADRLLTLDLATSSPATFGAIPSATVQGTFLLPLTPPAGAAGSYTVTATVTDKDGASTTATGTLTVVPGPVTLPTARANVTLPVPAACPAGTAPVTVRAEWADFLVLLNDYRADHGLGPVVLAPELATAADVHLRDMVTNRFFAHAGSDGSNPSQRATRAGYSGGTGENLALRSLDPLEALWAWRMSPGHNANMLDPTWKAIGIASGNGPDGHLWVNVFGDAVTCPTTPPTPPTPIVPVNTANGRQPSALAWTDDSVQPAFTISDLTPDAGAVVVVTNRSRSTSGPATAAVDLGNGTTAPVAADGSTSTVYLDPGSVDVTVHATGDRADPDWVLTLPVPVGGAQAPPTITLVEPPTTAAVGAALELEAEVVLRDGRPAVGRSVRFSVGGSTLDVTTGPDGRAHGVVVVPPPAGRQQVLAHVLDDRGAIVDTALADLAVEVNEAPTARAGGPYLRDMNEGLTLDGRLSGDIDGTIEAWHWDLGTDGDIDVDGRTPAEVPWPVLEDTLCAGTCEPGIAYPVRLHVIDDLGGVGRDDTTVTFVRDFGVFVSPGSQLIPPGGTNSFEVSVVTSSGFAEPVALSVTGLPTGSRSTFTPATVRPGEPSVLSITLPVDIRDETIDFAVTGTSGELVRTAATNVDVVFGLPPRCYGALTGRLLDDDTGAPVVGQRVDIHGTGSVITDADGRFTHAQVATAGDNGPQGYSLGVSAVGYHYLQTGGRTAVCGGTNDWGDLRIIPHHTGVVTGRVVEGIRDPAEARFAKVLPTDVPLGGAAVAGTDRPVTMSDSDGEFRIDSVGLNANNTERGYTISANRDGYWGAQANVVVRDGETVDTELALLKKCTVLFSGGRLTDTGGAPVPGATVYFGTEAAVADAAGVYTLTKPVEAGWMNSRLALWVTAYPPADRPDLQPAQRYVDLGSCGDVSRVDLVLPPTPGPSARRPGVREHRGRRHRPGDRCAGPGREHLRAADRARRVVPHPGLPDRLGAADRGHHRHLGLPAGAVLHGLHLDRGAERRRGPPRPPDPEAPLLDRRGPGVRPRHRRTHRRGPGRRDHRRRQRLLPHRRAPEHRRTPQRTGGRHRRRLGHGLLEPVDALRGS